MKLSGIHVLIAALTLTPLMPVRASYSAFQESDGQGGFALEVMERLTPEVTDPPVAFTIRKNEAEDILQTEEPEKVSAWQIQIYDKAGRKVSFIQGRSDPCAAAIPWAGTSINGEPLPDGFYSAKLVWLDPGKKVHATPKSTVTLFTPVRIRNLAGKKLQFDYTREGLVVSITESIMFKSGQGGIQEEALPALQEISRFLKASPRNLVTINGYTDSTGSFEKNLALSSQRAACVYQYLIQDGIDPGRLTYRGLGPAKPVAANTTETGRARNRRVEVVVLKTAG